MVREETVTLNSLCGFAELIMLITLILADI